MTGMERSWSRHPGFHFLLIALATPCLLFPAWWTPFGLLLVAISWLLRRRDNKDVAIYLERPLLILFLMLGVSLLISHELGLSLNRASVMVLGVAIFVQLAYGLESERQILAVGFGLLLLSIVIALISLMGADWERGLLIKSAFYSHLPTLIRGLPGSGVPQQSELFNLRMIAGTMAFLLPLPLSFLLWGEGWRWRVISALAVCLLSLTLLLTQSPQGLLGLSVALFVLTLLRVPRWWWLWPLGVALSLLAWNGYLQAALPPALVERLWIGVSARLEIWQRAIYMLRDMPFTGMGLNTFPIIDDKFYNLQPNQTPHAHNTFLQMAVDFGILGLIAFLALLWSFATTLVRAYKSSSNPNIRTLLLGIAGSVGAWLGYGLADALVLGHKAAIMIWVMFGLVAAVARLNGVPPPLRQLFEGGWEGQSARSASYPKAVWGLLGLAVLSMSPLLASALALNVSTFLMQRALIREHPPPEQAIQLAQQAVRWYEGNSRAYYLLGVAAEEQPSQALKAWHKTIKLEPSDYLAHDRLGWAYYEQGQLEKAIEQWRFSRSSPLIWHEAESHYRAGAWDEAIPLYQAVIALEPERVNAWYRLGESYKQQQQWEQALETFRMSIEKFPSQASGYARLSAMLYYQAHDPQEAIAVAKIGLEKSNDQKSKAWLYEQLARIYWGEGQLEEADDMAAHSTAADPTCLGCWDIAGHIALSQKRYQEALEAYQRTTQTSNSYWQWVGHSQMANVYLANDELELAMQKLQEAIRLAEVLQASETELSKLYTALAKALVQDERFAEAREALHAALQLDPTNQRAQEQLEDLIN